MRIYVLRHRDEVERVLTRSARDRMHGHPMFRQKSRNLLQCCALLFIRPDAFMHENPLLSGLMNLSLNLSSSLTLANLCCQSTTISCRDCTGIDLNILAVILIVIFLVIIIVIVARCFLDEEARERPGDRFVDAGDEEVALLF